MSESAFFAEPRIVTVRGKDLKVLPFESRNLKQAAKLAKPIFLAVAGTGAEATPENLTSVLSAGEVFDLFEHMDELIELAALSTGEQIEWVGRLYPDELLQIAVAVIQENADFFTQRLMPAAVRAFGEIAEGAGTSGQTSSSPSGQSVSAQSK